MTSSILSKAILQCSLFVGFRVDSVMLVDEGFNVVSTDASDKMLKYALKYRWEHRKEDRYDNWGKYAWLAAYL